jgi:hypothetical protein
MPRLRNRPVLVVLAVVLLLAARESSDPQP